MFIALMVAMVLVMGGGALFSVFVLERPEIAEAIGVVALLIMVFMAAYSSITTPSLAP